MPKKPSRKTQKRKADKLWREIIHAKGSCEICGEPGENAHHVIGRKNHTLRWDIRNGCFLCYKCHYKSHEDILEFVGWFQTFRTSDYNYLMQKKNEIWDLDYDKVLQYLKEAK